MDDICTIEEFEQVLNAYVRQLENTTEDNEDLLKDIIKIINLFDIEKIPVLCQSELLSHKLFFKFRLCYNVQLNLWRRKLLLSDYGRQVLAKLGSLFSALSKYVTNDNINTFERLLFDKSLIEELCLCLRDLTYRIDDSAIESIGQLVLSLWHIQSSGRTLPNTALQKQLIDAITECLTTPWYQMCLYAEMNTAQQIVFSACLDYVIDFADECQKCSCETIFSALIAEFPEWFHQQVMNSSIVTWDKQILHIISKLISILTNQIWKYDKRIDEVHLDSYKTIVRSLSMILCTSSIKYNQADRDKNDLTISLFLQHLTDLVLDRHLLNMIKQKNLTQVFSYFTQSKQLDIQLYAYNLLTFTLTKAELLLQIDPKEMISVSVKSLPADYETSKLRQHCLIATMNYLQRSLQYESIKEEFIKHEGICRVKRFVTCFEKNSFIIRNTALKVIRVLYSHHIENISNDMTDTISEMRVGSEEKWLTTVWKLHNWNNDKKEGSSSVTVSIPVDNFDPSRAVQAVLKHNQSIADRRLKCAAQRNREDVSLVWIYSDEDEIALKNIVDHLRALVHTVRVYSDVQSSEAIKFILQNREQRVFVLIHNAEERNLVRHIQHTVQIASIIVYGVSTTLQDSKIVSYKADLYSAIDLLATMIQSNRNQAFWFYESKQTLSVDLSAESAAFFFQLLLHRILVRISPIDTSELITLALQWYKKNPLILCEIEQFRQEYHAETAKAWFFTNGSSFVQRLVQQAFKQSDTQIIWAARFFIADLMNSIKAQPCTDRIKSRIVLGELMSAKRVQFLLEHRDTLLMPKGFLLCCTNQEKVIHDIRSRPRHQHSVHAVLFEIDRDDCPVLILNDAEYVMFAFDVSFRIITIQFDSFLGIYRIQLKTIGSHEIHERLWKRHMDLRQEAGEFVDENILFGVLLVDMNRVPAAMNYYSFYMENCSFHSISNVHRLVGMGRTALRCGRLEEADQYYTQAITLYEALLPSNDACFVRLLLDLIFIYIKQENNEQALEIYERVQILLANECSLSSPILRNLTQGFGCLYQIATSNIRSARQILKTYVECYKQQAYRCTHPVLIVGLAIDIGNLASKQGYFDMSDDCYTFAFDIGNRNLPLCHPMVNISLERLLANVEMLSTNNNRALSIRETHLLPLLQKMLSDINDDDSRVIADTMHQIGFEYIKLGMHENARSYLEKCVPIYRRQFPRDVVSLNQCQAYLFKEEVSLDARFFNPNQSISIDSLMLSAWYQYSHPADQIEADEQQQLWSFAMPEFSENMKTGSKVVQRTLVVWVDASKNASNNSVLLELLASSHQVELHVFDSVNPAISFLLNKNFVHVQVVVHKCMADAFFVGQEAAKLQSIGCLTMCVFVFGVEHNEEFYTKYLSYLQCRRKCWTKMPTIAERCLIISNDCLLLRQFCMIPDSLGMAIASVMFLVDNQVFGNMFLDEVDPITYEIARSSSETNVEFVGYMSGCNMSEPKLLEHLRFAKPIPFPKNDAQVAAVIMFGRRHGLSSEQIASICRYFSPGCCISPATLLKYLVRLWSLESPPFYRLVNQSLAECDIEDVRLLRFIVYDYFELFNSHLLPYFVGTLYRGIQTSEDNIATLLSLMGEQIYFVCFTSTSKNLARALVGGNVVFEIETLTKKQQEECRVQTNADISTLSQFPEEEEVIYAPLSKFRLLGFTFINDPNESVQYIVKIREQVATYSQQLFLDKVRLPNGTPFQSGTDMWQYKK